MPTTRCISYRKNKLIGLLSDNERALLAQVETQLQAQRELQDLHTELTRTAAEERAAGDFLRDQLEESALAFKSS